MLFDREYEGYELSMFTVDRGLCVFSSIPRVIMKLLVFVVIVSQKNTLFQERTSLR